jgi:acetoin utilization deacetylase AcuC-like enzyme
MAEVVRPAVERFAPELILVSAGFDAHWMDPLAGMHLSLAGFAHLNDELNALARTYCGGHIVYCMEGGYNLDALGFGWQGIARQLLGDTARDPLGPAPEAAAPDIMPVIRQAQAALGIPARPEGSV